MKSPTFPTVVLLINGCVPAALLAYDAYSHHLGPNPINFALRTTGFLAILFLVLSLAVTPLRKLTGYNKLSLFRRTLGLFAFAYATLHFMLFIFLDQAAHLSAAVTAIVDSRRNLFGLASLLLMVPLALTSTTASIKRLGAANWKRLHRLVYLAATAGAIHYCMVDKSIPPYARDLSLILAALLMARLLFLIPRRAVLKSPAAPV